MVAGTKRGPVLTLYARSYCHLCEDMRVALEALRGEFAFSLEVVEVDSDPDLVRRFDTLVPVLVHAGTELCHYHLDTAKVRDYLAVFR